MRKSCAAKISEADIREAWLGQTSHVLLQDGRGSDAEEGDVDQSSHSSDHIDNFEEVEDSEELWGEANELDDGVEDYSRKDEKDSYSDDSEYVVDDDADDEQDGRNSGEADGTPGSRYGGALGAIHGSRCCSERRGGHVDSHVGGHVGRLIGDRGGTQGTVHDTPGSGSGNYLRLDATFESPDGLMALKVEDKVDFEQKGGVRAVCSWTRRSIVLPVEHMEDPGGSLSLCSLADYFSPYASDKYPSCATETSRDTMGIYGTDPIHSLEAALDDQRYYSGSWHPLRLSSLQEGSDSRGTSQGIDPDVEVAAPHAEIEDPLEFSPNRSRAYQISVVP